MTSPCEVHIFTYSQTKANQLAKKILENSKKLEQKYNFYNPNSFLSQINQRKIDKLDFQTQEILKRAKNFYYKTDTIFDITIGTLTQARKQKSIQAIEEETQKLLPFVGVEHFKIKKNRISFDNSHTLIDLSGFVKEFAIDQAIKILKKAKIKSALVNFGGDIYALGTKPNSQPFVVGIKNPLNPKEHIKRVALTNQALTTSASYERFLEVEDKTYSHIIDKSPIQTDIISATVIASNAVESGVYSTSLMIKPTLKCSLSKILIDEKLRIVK